VNENLVEAQPDGIDPPAVGQSPFTEIADKLAVPETCPKFEHRSAEDCPALGTVVGGKHYVGERVYASLLESVKEGGQARLRGYLSTDLADAVIREGLAYLTRLDPSKSRSNVLLTKDRGSDHPWSELQVSEGSGRD
jgi:hypothetical protein